MRRRIVLGLVIAALGILCVFIVRPRPMTPSAFALYPPLLPELPVRFEYPADWYPEPSRGTTDAYVQIQLYAPAAFEPRLRTYMVIRAMPPIHQGGRYHNIDELVEEYRNTLLPSLRINVKRHIDLQGAPATVLELTGSLRLPWKSSAAETIPVHSQRIFFERGGRFFELAWMATPEGAPTVQEYFAHLMQTLQFVE